MINSFFQNFIDCVLYLTEDTGSDPAIYPHRYVLLVVHVLDNVRMVCMPFIYAFQINAVK